MDWSKTKNIFIITFLLLNILLGYQLYLKENEKVQGLEWATYNLDELNEILEQQNITLNSEIPKNVPQMHFLQVKNEIMTNYSKTKVKIQQFDGGHSIEPLLKDFVFNYDEYNISEIDSNGENYFVFYQNYQSIPFLGARLEVYINDDRTLTFRQNYFEVLNQGMDRQIISSYSGLRTVLDQQAIPRGANISQIALGYHGQTNQTATQLLTPVWRIIYTIDGKKGEVMVNAMTGGLQNILNY